MLQHSGRESKANCESDSLSLSLSRPLAPSFHFHSPLLLPLSALKQLPPLMRGTFQRDKGGGREGEKGVEGNDGGVEGGEHRGGEGNKRLHDDCTTIQKLLKGGHSSLGEDASSPPQPPPPPSAPALKTHAAIHQRGEG